MPREAAFDLTRAYESQWPIELRPVGEGTIEKEAFGEWWIRHSDRLAHLPPDLCEQWIHRHWMYSPFKFLPLETLQWERQKWEGDKLLSAIYRSLGGELNPKYDYKVFQRKGGENHHPTALALDAGTWDYPMILLSTPNGIIESGYLKADVRLVIVEGHQRHRYLNALHFLDQQPDGPHEVIIISSPTVSPQL